MAKDTFSADEARNIGERLGIDWTASPVDVEQFAWGWTSSSSTARVTRRRTSPTTTR
jgi:hypothetical protein